jgi:energy-coupling factor transporter ATP-binding protein EcfA2
MLTRLRIRNFKQFDEVDIELGQSVVFVGPNNSGKTTALQALALWAIGLEIWSNEIDHRINPRDHYDLVGDRVENLSINRLSLLSIPIPQTKLLWRQQKIIDSDSIDIDITVEGITHLGEEGIHNWAHNYKYTYANDESIQCSMGVPHNHFFYIDSTPKIAFLPPMSGLAAVEPRIDHGRINVLIGEGRTAEVLRNLCYQVYEEKTYWPSLVNHIRQIFGVKLLPPEYLVNRGEIRMSYRDRDNTTLDLSASGRGMLQLLLLLAYIYTHPRSILLLDEPDAHLDIIRQRQVYQLLSAITTEEDSQIIIATHSEVILEEAVNRNIAVAFVGNPHRIDKSGSKQILKALKQIRATDYYLAEVVGWVLYLKDRTHLNILKAFSVALNHPAEKALESAFVYDLGIDILEEAESHFLGLCEAKSDLVGLAIFEPLQVEPRGTTNLKLDIWQHNIEFYLSVPEALIRYARYKAADAVHREQVMHEAIELLVPPLALQNPSDKLWIDTIARADFLDRLFELYFEKLGLPNLMRKTNFHVLANFVPANKIDPEVHEKLNAIVAVANHAKPKES